ncbi:MAG TPA: TonB-dependent receptor, partial [Polyangiaceae bacterium]|nr:TonB-dependent receptor [Polyangiaceae bacterium]
GYPARYGRFSGGIVTAETTPPRPELHGEANIRLFDAGALVEAPFASGRGAALAGGRYSYTGGILSLVAPEVTLGYWDYQLRLSYLAGKDRVGVFGFGSYDFFSVDTGDDFQGLSTEFHRLDLRHERRVDARTLLRSAITIGYERTGNETLNGDDVDVIGEMLALRSSVEHAASQQALFRAGVDVEVDNYSAQLASQDDFTREAIPSRVDSAAGLWGDVVWQPEPGVTVTPGLRLDGYASGRATALGIDPRLSARFQVSRRVAIEHAFGIVHQTPSFVVPIPGFALGGLRGGLQRAVQTSSGVEVEMGAGFTGKASVFQNAMFNLSDLLSLVRAENQVGNVDVNTRMTGHSYGFELMLRRPLTEHLGGYFAYTLSRSERRANGVDVVASFDRTHVLHAALAYDLGRRWRAGTRFTYYTGAPAELDFGDQATGTLVAPGPIEQQRAPSFYRLDVRLEKKWLIGTKGAWWSFIVEVLNTTLNKEVFDYRCGRNGCSGEEFGPVTIPSIGLEAAF